MSAINIYNLPGAEGCEAAGPNMGPYAYRSWNSLSSKYACAWDYPAAAVIQQPVDSVDFIGRATFRIGEQHEAYVELTGSKVKVAKTFEPNQISSSTSTAATSLGPVGVGRVARTARHVPASEAAVRTGTAGGAGAASGAPGRAVAPSPWAGGRR